MKKTLVASGLVASCAIWMIVSGAKELVNKPETLAGDEIAAVASAPSRAPASMGKPTEAVDALHGPLTEAEKESVKTFVRILAAQESIGSSTQKLVAELEKNGLKPVLARNANAATGQMAMVRTENALPGTRYFHAQLFEKDGGAHMQHVSFEIRPGSDAMDTAVSLIKASHRDLGEPLVATADYSMWRNRDGRIVSAKRLGAEDLKDSYFNAHTAQDVGTIWVTSEDDPEEADAGH